MFGKFKEKLKSWFKSSTEAIEEKMPEQIEEIPLKKHRESKEKEILSEEQLEVELQKPIEELSINPIVETEIKEIIEFEPKSVAEAEFVIKETQKKATEIEKEEKYIEAIEEIPETHEFVETIENLEETRELEQIEKPKEKHSFFSKLKSVFIYKITEDSFTEIFDSLESILLESNVALEVVDSLREKLARKLIGKQVSKDSLQDEIKKEVKESLNALVIEPDNPLDVIKMKKPFVILFFGVNGTGKTTSIAKIAYFLKKSGLSVVLAAGDTFRAASIEQLTEHANRLNVPIIKQEYNTDPASVGYDAIKYAEKHKIDVVLIDTAGRMHTKANLIKEMEKISRVTNPDLKIFVAESIAGNDAVEQAKTFNEAIGIDGSLLSKTDIDEKGGTIISVSYATNKPIFFLGTGQNYEDLQLFNKQRFIESLGL